MRSGAQTFILVHDILPVTFSKFYQAPWRYQFADNLLAAIRNASGLLSVSNYSATGVLDFAHKNGAELESVKVVHNGFDHFVEDDDLRREIDLGFEETTHGSPEAFRVLQSSSTLSDGRYD